ncbi:MAG TPA: carboxypeptidase-like regulatory domain-containing protein [Lunatimonas sp.]|nr:carboxypeptidase-like regulatory domain-containing protein [Lunatimonas sp.]
MKQLLSLAFFVYLLFLGFLGTAQQISISGRIVDGSTKEVLPFASIFINNSMQGTVSDENGQFELKVNEGFHEIVVSMVGYDRLVYQAEFSTKSPRYLFELAPYVVELKELEVNAVRSSEWYENLRIFQYHFLGNSENGIRSEILNPEVLVIDGQENSLKAKSVDFLEIENHGLGLRIRYLLSSFEYNVEEALVHFMGYPTYSELDGGRLKINRWAKARERAYLGSWMHFKRALRDGKLSEEGFEVRSMENIPNPDRPDDQIIGEAKKRLEEIQDLSYSLFRDSLTAVVEKETLPKTIEKIGNGLLPPDAYSREVDGAIELDFENYLQITYTKAKLPREYVQSFQRGYRPNSDRPVSNIRLVSPITIYPSGQESNPLHLHLYGYWAWQKMADSLPMDYPLEEKY